MIDRYIDEYANTVIRMAKHGNTSCFIDIYSSTYSHYGQLMDPYMKFPSIDEFIAGFKRKFPDCSVSYKEEWHTTNTTVRTLKTGILVDWS